MIRLEMKNYNMILIERQPKYQLYHQVKFINMDILPVKIYYHLINNKYQRLAKFTYSPLGKAFEKEIKTIEDQGKKQVEVLKDLKPKEQTKPITHKLDDDDDDDDDVEVLKQKETYNKLFDEKLNEIREISKEMDYKSLIYAFTTKVIGLVNFIEFKGPFSLLKEIRNGDISLKMAKKYQKNLKRKLDQIKSGNPKHESGKQLYTIENVKNLFDSRQKNY